MKYSIFHIEGGLGKNIAATAVAKAIKNNFPDRKLVVTCGFPEIFINLPYVDFVYRLGTPVFFYNQYIKDNDSLLFHNNPYFTTDFIYNRKSLIEIWCDMYGLKFSGETPDLIFNPIEYELAEKAWKRPKPIMIIHTNGGGIGDPKGKQYCWTRDMPQYIAQELINHYKEKYHIIQVAQPNSKIFSGVETLVPKPDKHLQVMEYLSLLLFAEKRVLIDSSLEHAAAALNLKSTVLWIGTNPAVFSYPIHDNFVANIPPTFKSPTAYLIPFELPGIEYEYPFIDKEKIFDIEQIIESVDNQ